MSNLYLAVGSILMLTYNLWVDVGYHNGAKGKVVDFYTSIMMDIKQMMESNFQKLLL